MDPAPPPRSARLLRAALIFALLVASVALVVATALNRRQLVARYLVHELIQAEPGDAYLTALEALRNQSADRAHSALVQRLDDPDPHARQACAYALSELEGESPRWAVGTAAAPEARVLLMKLLVRHSDASDAPALSWPDEPEFLDGPRVEFPPDLQELLRREAAEALDPVLRWRACALLTRLAERDASLLPELIELAKPGKGETQSQTRYASPSRRQLTRYLAGFDRCPPRPRVPLDRLRAALPWVRGSVDYSSARLHGLESLPDEHQRRVAVSLLSLLDAPQDVERGLRRLPVEGIVEDALWLLAELPADDAAPAVEALLSPSWLGLLDAHPRLRPALETLFTRLRDPDWAPILERLLRTPRPQHWPPEPQFSFTGERWCEAPEQPCPGELPWFALLSLDPERAMTSLRDVPRPEDQRQEQPASAHWPREALREDCGCTVLDLPRREALLRFLRVASRLDAVARRCGSWLASWRTTSATSPGIHARRVLLGDHPLRHTTELRVALCVEILVAEGGADSAAALERFGRAREFPGPRQRRSAALATPALRGSLPEVLVQGAARKRALLRRALDADGSFLLLPGNVDRPGVTAPGVFSPDASSALCCLALLSEPDAAQLLAPTLRRLTAGSPLDRTSEELLVLWALARARRLGIEPGAAGAALERRLPPLLEADDWPYFGSTGAQALALQTLEQVSPAAATAGRTALAEVVPDDVEAVPLGTFALGLGSLAGELGVAVRREQLGPVSLDEPDFGGGDPGLGIDEAAVFNARVFRARDATERRQFCWAALEGLATDDPDQALTGNPACWLLILEGVEEALRRGGGPAAPPKNPPRAPTSSEHILLQAPRAGMRAESWRAFEAELAVCIGLQGHELVRAAPADLVLTAKGQEGSTMTWELRRAAELLGSRATPPLGEDPLALRDLARELGRFVLAACD